MKQRSLIKSQIIRAWKQSIGEDYCNQRINSERSLQASFWSHLNRQLPPTRRIFIEPSIRINVDGEVKKLIPDIVVCNTREVISVIELKYLPRVQPTYGKDLQSLALIAENKNEISIANERFRGPEKDNAKYWLSKNILFVWAGVHAEKKAEENSLYSAPYSSLNDCYIELHAATNIDSKPNVYIRK